MIGAGTELVGRTGVCDGHGGGGDPPHSRVDFSV